LMFWLSVAVFFFGKRSTCDVSEVALIAFD
jgi:hypothetical protein